MYRSNGITAGIIIITLIVGINTPDIEKVLGIVGSTIGNIVCILIPSVIFIKLTEKDTTERIGAKVMAYLHTCKLQRTTSRFSSKDRFEDFFLNVNYKYTYQLFQCP